MCYNIITDAALQFYLKEVVLGEEFSVSSYPKTAQAQ